MGNGHMQGHSQNAVGDSLTGETFSKLRAVLRLSHCLGTPSPLTLPFMRDVFFFPHKRKQVVLSVELQVADFMMSSNKMMRNDGNCVSS